MSIFRKIVQKYFGSKYDRDIVRDFAFWLNEKENEDLKDEALRDAWDNLQTEADDSTLSSFQTFEQTNMLDGSIETGRKKITLVRTIARIASILLLPILSATITYYMIKSDEIIVDRSTDLVEYVVPNGETRSIYLPDSSFVKLNSGSILFLPKVFSEHERTVYLSGEAYFDVAHDKARPFRVKTSDIDIEVLGTIFNISSYQTNLYSSASLKEGKLKVHVKKGTESHLLSPGEQVRYDKQTMSTVLSTEIQDTYAWLEGNLCISKASINELTELIERKYGVNVYLSSTKFKKEKITMNLINNENLEECMNILYQIVPDLQYKIEEKNVFIY